MSDKKSPAVVLTCYPPDGERETWIGVIGLMDRDSLEPLSKAMMHPKEDSPTKGLASIVAWLSVALLGKSEAFDFLESKRDVLAEWKNQLHKAIECIEEKERSL